MRNRFNQTSLWLKKKEKLVLLVEDCSQDTQLPYQMYRLFFNRDRIAWLIYLSFLLNYLILSYRLVLAEVIGIGQRMTCIVFNPLTLVYIYIKINSNNRIKAFKFGFECVHVCQVIFIVSVQNCSLSIQCMFLISVLAGWQRSGDAGQSQTCLHQLFPVPSIRQGGGANGHLRLSGNSPVYLLQCT